MEKTNIKVIGILISILLLLIGNVSAEDNQPDMTVEDSVDKMSDDNSSTGVDSIAEMTEEDMNGSSTIEDIVFEDVQETQTKKMPSPGFESMITIVAFLSTVIIVMRIRKR